MNVAVLGESPWSQAVATLIAEAGHTPKIGKESNSPFSVPSFSGTTQWKHLTKECTFVIFTCESEHLKHHIQLAGLNPRNQVLVNSGISAAEMKWTRDIILENSPVLRVGNIGGARLTDEVLDRTPTSLVVASPYNSVMDLAKETLHSDICRIYTSTDCVGVDLARLFVDMIQLAMGISDGLSCGHGTRGTIVSRGLIEGARLGEQLGAQEHSFLGISGIGELISTLEDTPYYRFGLQTIETGSMPTAGMEVLDILLRLNADNPQSVDLPLTQALKALGQQKLTPSLLIDMLMRRKPTAE